MRRHRSTTAKLIFSLFVLLALYIGGLFSAGSKTTIFIAFMTLAWHTLANIYCSWIASYRFKDPAAKYIEIKNKYIRKLFVRPCSVEGIKFTYEGDNRTNIIGLVLNILNTFLFVSFEILLLMPKIPCDPYVFTFVMGTRPRNYSHFQIELHSVNEIIPAETSRLFAFAMALTLLVFVALFERQLKEHRRKIKRNSAKTPRPKPLKKTAWCSSLYTSLIDISIRQNNKKHTFWYDADQLEQIENLVKAASENAELKLETKRNKLVSFKVIDTLYDRVVFKGLFT